jgi:beta-N-acetylhexosaminidase
LDRRGFLLGGVVAATCVQAAWASGSAMGNCLITGFRGTGPGDSDVDTVRAMLSAGTCAGVILLRRNCVSPEQVSRLAAALREAAGDLAPVIGIDQEGGSVARLDGENGFQDWRAPAELALMAYSDSDLLTYWGDRALQMADVGINLNFAPVVDLNLNPKNPIIGKLWRSFSPDPDEVVRYADLFIRAHHTAKVKTSLKHFPGHGSSTTDSHKGSTDISQSWRPIELEPFEVLTQTGRVDSVMNSHVLHPEFSDGQGIPASLSRKSIDAIRSRMGFAGAVFTDDMQMAAAENAMPFDAAVLAAVNAGNTFLIYSNYRKGDSIETVRHALAALEGNAALLDGAAIVRQVATAIKFRRDLI